MCKVLGLVPQNTPPNKDLKHVFVHCISILDHSPRGMENMLNCYCIKQACEFAKYSPVSQSPVTLSQEGELDISLSPEEYKQWTWQKSTPWVLENLWMCLETHHSLLWSQRPFADFEDLEKHFFALIDALPLSSKASVLDTPQRTPNILIHSHQNGLSPLSLVACTLYICLAVFTGRFSEHPGV